MRCRRCGHIESNHTPLCQAWDFDIPGLPDAHPCQCSEFLP